MVRIGSVLTSLMLPVIGFVQPAIPNGSFEMWDTTFMPPRPTGYTYYTRNNLPVVVADSNARWGNLCARMESLLQDTGLHGNVFNGRIVDARNPFPDMWGGSPYTLLQPPDSIIFYYKYTYTQQDTAEVYMVLKKFGAPIDAYPGGNGVRSFLITDTTSQWQRYSAPIGWLSRTPDTVFLAFLSTTRYHPKTGSTLWIDSVHFDNHSIFNGGFELWDAPVIYLEPTGWTTNNSEVIIDYVPSPVVMPTTSASVGNYALKVVSEPFDFEDTTVGYALLFHTFSQPLVPKPSYLLFDYRSWIDSPYAAWIRVRLGEVLNDSFLVYGYGMRYLSSHPSNWRTDTVWLSYPVPHDVVTLSIDIVVRSPSEVGDSILIDNLRWGGLTTDRRSVFLPEPSVYAVSGGRVVVRHVRPIKGLLVLTDVYGRIVSQVGLASSHHVVYLSNWAPYYVYRLYTDEGIWHGILRMRH